MKTAFLSILCSCASVFAAVPNTVTNDACKCGKCECEKCECGKVKSCKCKECKCEECKCGK